MNAKPSSHLGALLTDAPLGYHFAQLHRDAASRTASAVTYLASSLRRGSGTLMVAEPANVEACQEKLHESGFDPVALRNSGQFEVVDAAVAVDTIVRGGKPDRAAFRAAIGPCLDRLQAFGPRGVRACGEMVGVLWQRGEVPAALAMEEYWGELTSNRRFTHFCSYLLDHRHPATYGHPIHEIGRAHSDIVPTDDDDRFHLALDAAARDLFGTPLSDLVNLADHKAGKGEERLPAGHRMMLWAMRHLPDSSTALLERARRHTET